jgi:hypothetical protein
MYPPRMLNPAPRIPQLTRNHRSGASYVSPSDEIMSPCTAKLNALRNKQVGKYVLPVVIRPGDRTSLLTAIYRNRVKPKSLFAQASSKRLRGTEGLFGPKADSLPANKA